MRRRQRAGMQFRIAAGQPHRIGGGIGRLVGQRRERNDLRARAAPLPQQMRIHERKRRVLRQRDALPGGGRFDLFDARPVTGSKTCAGRAARLTASRSIEASTMSASLSSRASMPAVSCACTSPRCRSGSAIVSSRRIAPNTGKSMPLEGRRNQRKVPRAGDAVEDHAGDLDIVAISGAAERDRGGGFGLAGDIEHQQHRPAQQAPPDRRCCRSRIVRAPRRRRTVPSRLRRRRYPRRRCSWRSAAIKSAPIAQLSRLIARAAGGDLVKCRDRYSQARI